MKIKIFTGHLSTIPIVASTLALSVLSGFCANPVYPSVVQGDGALGYYRFNDSLTRNLININSGTLGAAGNATNDLATVTGGVVHSFPGAIAGDQDRAVFFDFTTRTEIPFNSALNTPNTQPFSVEAWIYPVNDQDTTSFGGMGVLANRWTQGGNRQGWVVYQRRPNSDYSPAAEGVGWEFRMYNDLDTSGHLDVVSQVPFQLGKWQHVVFVYDAPGGDPLVATLTVYVDGVFANAVTNTSGVQGYSPCTGNHDPAPNGQPAMALGNYNNANSGTFGAANPWFGGIDEYAWYPSALTPAQVLAHYQNGTNANRSQSYSSLVLSHSPAAYLRLNEIAPGGDIALNLGGVGRDANNGAGGAAGLGNHTAEVRHPAGGAVASDKKSGATAYHNRNGNSTTTIPFQLANNGQDPADPTTNSAKVPFTFEAWLRPMKDQQGGQAPVNNRSVGGTGRTGWVIFQRNPNSSYPVSEFYGWNFRMFSGNGSGGQDVLTGLELTNDVSAPFITNYTVGKWQHLVVTWEPQTDNGDPAGNGNNQWAGILTAYVDGVQSGINTNALYAVNLAVPEAGVNTASGGAPADLAIGSYNAASGIGSNPYEGDVAELAIYNNYILTPDQIMAHYQAGTNSTYGTNYSALVLTAAAVPPITERTTLPATYFRLNDIAKYPAGNSGSLGYLANGNLNLTTNDAAGPVTTGFENPNQAVPLDGLKQWVSLNNPAGLNISGQITLEAWVKPGATQGTIARIISHGPPTPSNFDPSTILLDGSLASTNEVFLRIEDAGLTYSVGSSDGFTSHTASAAVSGGDLGSAQWIHLAGTYDGTNWRLFRNGTQIGISASAVGALPIFGADWAIGSTGNGWADNFTGNIDEVAIYGTALTPATIAAHYYVGLNGPVSLSIAKAAGSTVTVTWPAGTLQESTSLGGTYTDVLVSGNPATSPYNTATGTSKFYRVKL
jgi:hypothetical protein